MKYFIAMVILVLGLGAGFYAGSGFNMPGKDSSLHIASTVKEILPISEYACLVFHYSDVITHSDSLKLSPFGTIPFTEKKAIYTIDGTVKLGFSGSDIVVESFGNNILVYLPKIRILSHEIYPETFNLYDERTGLFNRYGLKDANEIQMAHKTERENRINEDAGLFAQARESAEQSLKSLLENIPELKNKHRISFRWEY